jgi:acetoacetate decarboxylase
MLKGFSTPLSPKGSSGIVPPPPWTNAGAIIAIEYWADPRAVRRYLPKGFADGPDPGHAVAHFCEWQSTSESADELDDPVRGQYSEFFLLVGCSYQGKATFICPYMYVDNDINLYRGLIQGLPKQQAAIRITRSYPIANRSGSPLAKGSRFGATMSFRDRRIVDAGLLLEKPAKEPIGLAASPCLGLRHFPDLAQGSEAPLVHDIVAFTGSGRQVADIWEGEGRLAIHPHPVQELSDLAPKRIGRAMRYYMGFTIGDIRKVGDA